MKKTLLFAILAAVSATCAHAIDIPKSIYRSEQVSEAVTEAVEDETAVAYIVFPESIKIS